MTYHLESLAEKSESKAIVVLESLQALCKPATVQAVTSPMLTRYATLLRQRKRSESTIESYLGQIRAAIIATVQVYAMERVRDSKSDSH